MNPGDSRLALHALLLGSGALLAGVYALAKLAGEAGASPLGLLAWQMLFAAGLVGIVAAARGEPPALTRENLRYAAIAGFLGMSAPYLLTFLALRHLPAGIVGAITALSPAFTYAIVVALRMEVLQPRAAVGVLLGLGGAVAIAASRNATSATGDWAWALVAAAAPLMLAAANVFRSRAWPAGLKPLSAAALMLLLQALVLVPVAVGLGAFRVPLGVGVADTALLGAGLFVAAFYLGAFELQRRGGPVFVGQLGQVIALASLAIGILAFGERHGPATLLAVLAVLAGIALVNGRRPAAHHALGGGRRIR